MTRRKQSDGEAPAPPVRVQDLGKPESTMPTKGNTQSDVASSRTTGEVSNQTSGPSSGDIGRETSPIGSFWRPLAYRSHPTGTTAPRRRLAQADGPSRDVQKPTWSYGHQDSAGHSKEGGAKTLGQQWFTSNYIAGTRTLDRQWFTYNGSYNTDEGLKPSNLDHKTNGFMDRRTYPPSQASAPLTSKPDPKPKAEVYVPPRLRTRTPQAEKDQTAQSVPISAKDLAAPRPIVRYVTPREGKTPHRRSTSPSSRSPTATSSASARKVASPVSPDPAYISHISSSPSCRLTTPRRLLVILDLNGVLIHRPFRKRPQHFVPRPHLDGFLSYLFKEHEVMIWTSARRDNALAILRRLLSAEQRAILAGFWAREDLRLSKAQYLAKTQVYKRLEWVWDATGDAAPNAPDRSPQQKKEGPKASGAVSSTAASKEDGVVSREGLNDLPLAGTVKGAKGVWDQSNTVLVDDSVVKASAQPWNCLEVKEWVGHPDDADLRRVQQVIEELAWTDDIGRWFFNRAQERESGSRTVGELDNLDDVADSLGELRIQ